MRTRQRDHDGFITFGASETDAVSGSGVANGISYVWTRSATGTYVYNFDISIRPLAVGATGAGGSDYAQAISLAAGTFTLRAVSDAGVLSNDSRTWICFARDLRH